MLDVLHQGLGNKHYKLIPNLEYARDVGFATVVSFGGAWSNHIHTLAKTGADYGLKTIGIIRGEKPAKLSACLADAARWGMQLEFVSRSEYREKGSDRLMSYLNAKYGHCYLVPEGGSNALAIRACAQIVSDLNRYQSDYDLLVLPVGTGGTMAGIVTGLAGNVDAPGASVLGISVLKGADFLNSDVEAFLSDTGCPENMEDANAGCPEVNCEVNSNPGCPEVTANLGCPEISPRN